MRWLKILVFGGGGLLAVWIILRATNMLQFYSVPTASNEPTLAKGSYIFSSNLITPKRGDFICYKVQFPGGQSEIYTKRLCGMPGDTLQIKAGELYINGKNSDEGRNLKFNYKIPIHRVSSLKLPQEDMVSMSDRRDTVIARLDEERAKKIGAVRHVGQGAISEMYDQNWTTDFFGPYLVPEGHYFVMGDSRHNSGDSRYTGPVAVGDVVGVVLGK
jgi:signal peptidase I